MGLRSRMLCACVELRYYNILKTYLLKVVVHARIKSGCYGHLDWVCFSLAVEVSLRVKALNHTK